MNKEQLSIIPTTKYAPNFVGGRGIAAKLFWDEVPDDVEVGALDPRNALIFMTGPLTGTPSPTSGRVILTGKASETYPLEFYMRSAAGGHWGPELKFAGFDGIIIKGKSSEPVYLWIHDNEAEIRCAKQLWGLTTYNAQEEIWRRHDEKTKVMVIGPAGEKLARCSVILTDDGNTFGHGGYGAVMGSKNLKAIAVRGTGSVPVAKPNELLELVYKINRLITRKEDEKEPSHSRRQSRSYLSDKPHWASSLDVSGWISPQLCEEAKQGKIRLGFQGCFACPINCGFAVQFKDRSIPSGGAVKCSDIIVSTRWEERYYGKEPGYKPFGRVAYEYTKLCDLLGIDNKFARSANNWFGDCIDNGILNDTNTGLPISKAGSREFNREFLFKVAYREGIGDFIAEDAPRFLHYLAEKFKKEGSIEKAKKTLTIYEKHFSLSGKFGGLYNLSDHINDPFGMIYCAVGTCNRPGNKNLDLVHYHGFEKNIPPTTIKKAAKKLYGSEKALDPYTWNYKINKAITYERHRIIQDSLLYCEWALPVIFSRYTPDMLGDVTLGSQLYSSITGIDITYENLYGPVADRLRNLERCIQVREGRRREDDWYFDVIFESNKKWTNKEDFKKVMDKYYRTRGWNLKTGIPSKEKLEELGLKDVLFEMSQGL